MRKEISRFQEQCVGAVIALVGMYLTYEVYTDLLAKLAQYGEARLVSIQSMGPAFVVVGIGMFLFPLYRRERLARGEDITHLKGYALITTKWKVILAIGIIAEIAYIYILMNAGK